MKFYQSLELKYKRVKRQFQTEWFANENICAM